MSFMIRSKYWYERLVYILGDDFGYFAASLSFYTIFSFIPALWILFYVLSQFDAFATYYLGIKAFIVVNLVPAHSEMISSVSGFISGKHAAYGCDGVCLYGYSVCSFL